MPVWLKPRSLAPGPPQVRLSDGKRVWKIYVTPPNHPGAAVWGSAPSVDPARNSVYIATGDNYDYPPEVTMSTFTIASM